MTMMTIAICDDMQADTRRLHKQLVQIVPGSEIRIFKSGELLLEELEKKRKPYDVIFVNMDSKKTDGLNTIRKIREREMSVAVIFMSRSDEYYRDAFDMFAYNYLLKPVTLEALEYVMEPLKKRLNADTDERMIHFQYRARVYTLRHSQVSYITSNLHIVNFHMTDGSTLQCRGKLKDFEKQLENSTFLRCHQSFIVNMERITGAKTESFSIGENVIPISRSYNKTAHERYEEYLQLQQEISWGGIRVTGVDCDREVCYWSWRGQ